MKKSVMQRPVTTADTQRYGLTREGASAESGGKQLFFFLMVGVAGAKRAKQSGPSTAPAAIGEIVQLAEQTAVSNPAVRSPVRVRVSPQNINTETK